MSCLRALSMVACLVAGWFTTLCCATRSLAQFNEPELRSLSQTGAQVGTSIELNALGDRLDAADRMHFSHPGIQATVKPGESAPVFGSFVVQVGEDVPPGRYDARVIGRYGVSNPRSFFVNKLVNVRPASVSHDRRSPTPMTMNSIVHATVAPTAVDYYSVRVEANASDEAALCGLRIDVFAQRLDSRMLGQVKLLAANGRVLASARGADGIDPSLVVEQLEPGEYMIAVHDFLYRSGDDYHYQLAVREVEANDTSDGQGLTFGRSLAPASLTLADPNAEANSLQATERVALQRVPVHSPDDRAWTFAPDHGENLFTFNATQGDQLAIEVVSERLGEPTDARFYVQRLETDTAGVTKTLDVLRADDSFAISDGVLNLVTKDPTALFVAPATALYLLTIQDLDVGESLAKRQSYVLRVNPPQPSFDLAAYRLYPHNDLNQSRPHGSHLTRGGVETIRVMAVRRDGWAGPIRVSAQGLPEGVSCADVVMAANQSQTQLTLVAAEDAPAAIARVDVVGQSEDGSMVRQATPMTIAVAKGGNREFTRMRVADELLFAVSGTDVSPLTIRLAPEAAVPEAATESAAPESAAEAAAVPVVKKGETLKLAVAVTRRDGGKEPMTVRPKDLPPGVSCPEIIIAADSAVGTLVLTVTPNAAAGTYSLWSQAETKIKPTPESPPLTVFLSSTTVTFRIIEP